MKYLSIILLFCLTAHGGRSHRLSGLFQQHGVRGSIVISGKSGRLYTNDSGKMTKRLCPASTFKILNALIALECGVISVEKNRIAWDGKRRFFSMWNRDQTLSTALRFSCIWYFQRLARRIGRKRYLKWLQRIQYGNTRIGRKVDVFWLDGSLKISALEQLRFLQKLTGECLPFQKKHMKFVKQLLLVKRSGGYRLFAKTGWAMRIRKQIGWYVGWVEDPSGLSCFALNYRIHRKKQARLRRGIAVTGLMRIGLLPEGF